MRRLISSIEWRIALIALAISLCIWYYVKSSKQSRVSECKLPAFSTVEAKEAYRVCLEKRRTTQNLTNDDTGIKP